MSDAHSSHHDPAVALVDTAANERRVLHRIERAVQTWATTGLLPRQSVAHDVAAHDARSTSRGPAQVLHTLTNLRAKVASLPYWVYCETSRFAVLFRSRRDEEGSSETPITCSVVTFTTRGGLIREVWVSAGNLQSKAEPEVDWVRRWRLTPREVSVALLAAEGLRDKEIAVQLDLATASVSKYLTRVMHKAGARGRWDLPRLTGTAKLR